MNKAEKIVKEWLGLEEWQKIPYDFQNLVELIYTTYKDNE